MLVLGKNAQYECLHMLKLDWNIILQSSARSNSKEKIYSTYMYNFRFKKNIYSTYKKPTSIAFSEWKIRVWLEIKSQFN